VPHPLRASRGVARPHAKLLASAAVAIALLVVAVPAGAWPNPQPGTAAQVQRLVQTSRAIATLPGPIAKELASGGPDDPQRLYPLTANSCNAVTSCVFGDRASTTTVVLFGDSHALMWLPALAPWATKHAYRLVVLWTISCPAAQVTGFKYLGANANANPYCATWRAHAIDAIDALHPAAVLIAERTADIIQTSNDKPFTTAQWETGLQATLSQLSPSGAKLAMLEDITFFNKDVPMCLSANAGHVQACSVANPNRTYPGQQAAEKLAASSAGATFVTTLKWFCTARCSPIVGPFVVYYDQGHVAASYAKFLSGVLGTSLKALFVAA
jgi:hypothetical protein